MKGKFLLVYVGVDGDKLSDYARREISVVDLSTHEDSTDPTTEAIEEAAFELLARSEERPDKEALIAVIPMYGAKVYRVKSSRRVDVMSQVGGAI